MLNTNSVPSKCIVQVRANGFKSGLLDIFNEAAKGMADRLSELGFAGGTFFLEPQENVPGSSANKGIRPTRADGLFIIQLDGNDSAWKYKLVVPKPLTTEQLFARFKDTPAILNQEVREESSVPPKVTELFPSELLNDCEALAIGLFGVFSHLAEPVSVDALREHVEKQFAFSASLSVQFVQALVNRGFLKRHTYRGQDSVGLMESLLRDTLKLLGVPPNAPVAVINTSVLSPKGHLREQARHLAAAAPVHQCPPETKSSSVRPRPQDTPLAAPKPQLASQTAPIVALQPADELEAYAQSLIEQAARVRSVAERRKAAKRVLEELDAEAQALLATPLQPK